MIHQYKLGGYNIVLDVCSGAIHVVDEVAYDIIALFEENEKDAVLQQIGAKYPEVSTADIAECYEQVVALKESGKLFAPDTFEPV
ncbi:MAG: thioether cross-link-forming SCIFF peptide maturase, partial [Clostridia bacterium]|nr:thioether cross-link-forming SCIFF peptide maturase [Clostridia bacterium]